MIAFEVFLALISLALLVAAIPGPPMTGHRMPRALARRLRRNRLELRSGLLNRSR